MATPLKDRIRAAAIATSSLTALLGTSPFRWYDQQLVQGSAMPAVVVQIVSGAPAYVLAGRLPCSSTRVQFTLWGSRAVGATPLPTLEAALITFLDSLNLIGIAGLQQYQNLVVLSRDAFFPTPQPGNPQRIIDAMIYSNDTL